MSIAAKQPLGKWIPNSTHLQCKWEWLACPITLQLFHRTGHWWNLHALMHQCIDMLYMTSLPPVPYDTHCSPPPWLHHTKQKKVTPSSCTSPFFLGVPAQNCNNVNWVSLKLALRNFECNDCQCLQKFLHNWLPLQDALHMSQPASDHTCPVCQQAPENFLHCLECQHPSHKNAYCQLQTAIQQLHEAHHIDPHMIQLMWQGINSIHNQYPIEDQWETYLANFQALFIDWSHISWDQLFYGQILASWVHYINHSSQYKTNGTIFYSQLIIHAWKYILSSWSIHNAALHPIQPTQQTVQSLAPQVYHLFHIIATDLALHGQEPCVTPEQILQTPIWTIRNFLNTGYWQVRTHVTAAWTSALTHTRDILTYFCNILSNNDYHPP